MNNIRRFSSLSARHQHGLTLIEIMVALVLSLFLIAGVIQLFLGSKQTYRFHDAASRLQENGRLALDTMGRDIRMAGYVASVPPPPSPPNPFNAVLGTANDTNLLTVQWFDPGLTLPQCTAADGICSRNYSIRPRTAGGAVPTCPSAGTSLFFQRQGDATPQELVEGVESMQVLYGVCADANNDGIIDTPPPNYVNTAGVANWNLVCSVRIHLLLVSLENNVVTQQQAVRFPADTNTAWPVNDLCLRQAFSTTVAIRNRMP